MTGPERTADTLVELEFTATKALLWELRRQGDPRPSAGVEVTAGTGLLEATLHSDGWVSATQAQHLVASVVRAMRSLNPDTSPLAITVEAGAAGAPLRYGPYWFGAGDD